MAQDYEADHGEFRRIRKFVAEIPDKRRRKVAKATLKLAEALSQADSARPMAGPYGFPAASYNYEEACKILAKVQGRYDLQYLLRMNPNTPAREMTEAVEILASPKIIIARQTVDTLAAVQRGTEEERKFRQALQTLSDAGVYHALLHSDRFEATVFFASGPTALNETVMYLPGSDKHITNYTPVSGTLVRRADGTHTFLTDEWFNIWPAGLQSVKLDGYIPAVGVQIRDLMGGAEVAADQPRPQAILGSAAGNIVYAVSEEGIRTQQREHVAAAARFIR